AAAASLAFDPFGVASGVCAIPGPQPGLSDSCGIFGLGGRPSKAERLAWEARPTGNCEALRKHISSFPDGVFRTKAADLLTARKISYVNSWQPTKRTLTLFEPAAEEP